MCTRICIYTCVDVCVYKYNSLVVIIHDSWFSSVAEFPSHCQFAYFAAAGHASLRVPMTGNRLSTIGHSGWLGTGRVEAPRGSTNGGTLCPRGDFSRSPVPRSAIATALRPMAHCPHCGLPLSRDRRERRAPRETWAVCPKMSAGPVHTCLFNVSRSPRATRAPSGESPSRSYSLYLYRASGGTRAHESPARLANCSANERSRVSFAGRVGEFLVEFQ